MAIHLYTLCWNEMDIAPFVIDYWKRFVTKAVVYDNGSTDGSVEYLKQFDWIEVRHFDTEGLNDIVHMNIKNDCWRESRGKADWVVVCDFDEIVFSQDLEGELSKMRENGGTVLFNRWYAFRGDHRPTYKPGKLLHEIFPTVCDQFINAQHNKFGKIVLFDPNKIENIGYGVGSHVAFPNGDSKAYISDKIYTLHIDKGFGVEYSIARKKILNKRLSEENKKNEYSLNYSFSEEKMREEYMDDIKKSFNFNTLLASESSKSHSDKKLDLFISAYEDFSPPVSNEAYKIIVGNEKLEINTNLQIIECGNPVDILDDKFYEGFYMLRNLVRSGYNFAEYVGLCHHNKYFSFLDNIPDLDEEFKKCDAILVNPIKLDMSIYDQYKKCYNTNDLDIVGKIIRERYPLYYNIYTNLVENDMMFPYNMYIMKKDGFLDYISFVGDIMDEYINEIGEDIQHRIGGHLIEILTNIFIFKIINNVNMYDIEEISI